MSERTAAIVGLGLIGGSLARDLTARGFTVLGRDADRKTEQDALDEGAIAALIDDDYVALQHAQWLVIAVPVGAATDVLQLAAAQARELELVTDTGSTKRGIAQAAERLKLRQFVGAHPLAGDHRAGWRASRAGMFTGARVYLCPSPGTQDGARAAAHELWHLCGAHTHELSPDQHDRLLAHTSHLPQVVASALALALADAGVTYEQLGPGGRDMVRLAGSPPALWRDILSQNAADVDAAIRALELRLRQLRAALGEAKGAGVEALMREANGWRT